MSTTDADWRDPVWAKMANKTTEPAALAGIEPVAVAGKDYKRGDAVSFFTRVDIPKDTVIYSAATVERLVQERDKLAMRLSMDTIDAHNAYQRELAASQAREQQLREALKALQQGFPQTHQINAVIRHALVTPQDDTALRQWGAKLLRGMAEMDCFNDYMRERINRKADELEAGK